MNIRAYCVACVSVSLILSGVLRGQIPGEIGEECRLRVFVKDAFSRSGIEGMNISLVSRDGNGIAAAHCITDRTGECVFRSAQGARYSVLATGGGFSEGVATGLMETSEQLATVYLSKPGRLRGQVVERYSRAGLPFISVSARPVKYFRGRRVAQGSFAETKTDTDGAFRFDSLPSGDYVLEVWDDTERADTGKRPRVGFRRQIWPGGGDVESSSPLRVLSGSDQFAGVVELARERVYRVRLATGVSEAKTCASRGVRVSLEQAGRSVNTRLFETEATCGDVVEFPRVSSGRYEARVSLIGEAFPELFAYSVVIVGDQDIDQRAELQPPTVVHGSVRNATSPENVEVPRGVSIKFWPQGEDTHRQVSFFPTYSPAPVETDGAFAGRVYVPPTGQVQLIPFGLPENMYIEGLKYNGRFTAGTTVELDRYVPDVEIEALVGMDAAIVGGTIANCDGCSARVIAVPTPPQSVDQYPVGAIEGRARNGRFSISRLPPGKYKIVAISDDEDNRIEEPGRLSGLLASGEEIELSQGQRAMLTVSLSRY